MEKKKQRGLGRGIGALFNEDITPAYEKSSILEEIQENKKVSGSVVMLKVRDIEPNPKQPRRNFDLEKLEALSESLKTHGVIQPVLVKENKNGMYTIIAGERRWRASKLAGLKEIPCIIKEFDEKELMEVALIENLQREDLNPIEEAEGYKNLMEKFEMTQDEVSERVGKSRSAVANTLRLNKLSDKVKAFVIDGSLSGGHARTLLAVEDKDEQFALAEKIIKEGLSVRQTEKLVSVEKLIPPQEDKPKKSKDEKYYLSLEKKLSSKLGTKVKIQPGKKKSKIEIEYYSKEDLERLLYELSK